MYKCKICGKEFELQKGEHYVTRDASQSGIAKVIVSTEEKIYDTFDCPHCGCQNVMQERKRNYSFAVAVAEEEECSDENDWLAEIEDEKEECNDKEDCSDEREVPTTPCCYGGYDDSTACLACECQEECAKASTPRPARRRTVKKNG